MVEKREKHRRRFIPVTRFPLTTRMGDVMTTERRTLPARRVNDIQMKELGCKEFLAELHLGK